MTEKNQIVFFPGEQKVKQLHYVTEMSNNNICLSFAPKGFYLSFKTIAGLLLSWLFFYLSMILLNDSQDAPVMQHLMNSLLDSEQRSFSCYSHLVSNGR